MIVVLMTCSLSCTRGVDDDPIRTNMGVAGLAGQRAGAADRWMETLADKRKAGEPLTPMFVGRLIDAARQQAIARADATPELALRQAAYKAYRDYCGQLLRELDDAKNTPAPMDSLAQVRYAIADAEWRMGQVAPP
jgi:hypothetical protein